MVAVLVLDVLDSQILTMSRPAPPRTTTRTTTYDGSATHTSMMFVSVTQYDVINKHV